jgi:hypothetical protein
VVGGYFLFGGCIGWFGMVLPGHYSPLYVSTVPNAFWGQLSGKYFHGVLLKRLFSRELKGVL